MPRLRDFRQRIRGVQKTQKITHAMELVAATRMRRAVASVLATRRYVELARELLHEVRQRADVAHHPLLERRSPVRRSLLLVVAGNRGLVGSFHHRLAALASAVIAREEVPLHVMTAGRVAARLVRRFGVHLVADFPKKDLLDQPADAAPIAEELLRVFLAGEADRVRVVYGDFVSPARQEMVVRTLLPVGEEEAAPALRRPVARQRPETTFTFEPSPQAVLRAIVPNLLAIQVYQALLETTASEHAARMVAMRNATDNAQELLDELTLTLNRARQQQVTTELQEMFAGGLAE